MASIFLKKVQQRSWVVPVVFMAFIMVAKWKSLFLPYYWDEFGFFEPTSWLAQGNMFRILPGLYPPELFHGHPPGLNIVFACIYTMFGETFVAAHAGILVFSFLGTYFTYRLTYHLVADRVTAVLAALFLFFSPIYFAHSVMLLCDLPVAAVGVMTVYYLLKKKYIHYLVSGIFLVLLKETAMAIVVAGLCYYYLTHRKEPAVFKGLVLHSIPLFLIGGFFLMQKIATGRFFPSSYIGYYVSFFDAVTVPALYHKALFVARIAFVHQGRIVLTLLAGIASLVAFKRLWKKEFLLFIGIISFFVATFSLIFFSERYLMPILPYYCIIGACAVRALAIKTGYQCFVGMCVIAVFVSNSAAADAQNCCGNFECDMQYVDVVTVHKKAAQYVVDRFPEKKIVAAWPFTRTLTDTRYGYVTATVDVVDIGADFDVLVYSPLAAQEHVQLKEIITTQHLVRVEQFNVNGKSVAVYVHE